jgi:hypothetical protein
MRYYTKFELHAVDVETGSPITMMEEGIIAKRLWELLDGSDRYTPKSFDAAIGEDSMKWYNHEEDMITLSKEYPNILFVLEGIGEEFPDAWRKWFHNGQFEESYAEVIYPRPVNPLFARYNF